MTSVIQQVTPGEYVIKRDRPVFSSKGIRYDLVLDSNWPQFYDAQGNVDQNIWQNSAGLSFPDKFSKWYRYFGNDAFYAYASRTLNHAPGPELQSYDDIERSYGGDPLTYPSQYLTHQLTPQQTLLLKARPAMTVAPHPDEASLFGKDYVSGQINTGKVYEQAFGYWEVKARCGTPGAGLNLKSGFPAIWLVSSESVNGTIHEMDIFEADMDQPDHFRCGALQRAGRPYTGSIGQTNYYDIRQWHTYGFEWTPEIMSFFIDGAPILEIPNYHDLMSYLIINLALWDAAPGFPGSSPDAPDVNTDWANMWMEIEYARIWASEFTKLSSDYR